MRAASVTLEISWESRSRDLTVLARPEFCDIPIFSPRFFFFLHRSSNSSKIAIYLFNVVQIHVDIDSFLPGSPPPSSPPPLPSACPLLLHRARVLLTSSSGAPKIELGSSSHRARVLITSISGPPIIAFGSSSYRAVASSSLQPSPSFFFFDLFDVRSPPCELAGRGSPRRCCDDLRCPFLKLACTELP